MLYDERDEFAASAERLRAMQGKEMSQYGKSDYLSDEWQRKLAGAAVDEFGTDAMIGAPPAEIREWRCNCNEWLHGTVDYLGFDREIASLAMSYIDCFLGRRSVDQRAFKLTMLAALYLAIKLSVSGIDKDPRVLRFLLLSCYNEFTGCNEFTPEDVAAAEMDLLAVIEWRVHPPTPAAFCREFLSLLPATVPPAAREKVRETAAYLTELSVGDYVLSTCRRPSSVALAALLVAMERKGPAGVDPARATELLQSVAAGVDTGEGKDVVCRARLLFHFHL